MFTILVSFFCWIYLALNHKETDNYGKAYAGYGSNFELFKEVNISLLTTIVK